jgi:carboxymethylenebutenolidase
MIELTSGDGHSFSAYRAEPSEKPKGAVVVLQDAYGVSPHLQKEVDAFAARGYVAIAPALFDREKKGAALPVDESGAAAGDELAKAISVPAALQDIQAAVDAVKDAGKVAVVGYSWGGYLAFLAANKLNGLACAIAYSAYGIMPEREKRRVPTLLHFPEQNPAFPSEDVECFRFSHPDVSAFAYPTAEGFNFEGAQTFDASAAESAKERTLFWISQFVEGQGPVQLKNAGAYALAKTDKKKKKADDDMGPPSE